MAQHAAAGERKAIPAQRANTTFADNGHLNDGRVVDVGTLQSACFVVYIRKKAKKERRKKEGRNERTNKSERKKKKKKKEREKEREKDRSMNERTQNEQCKRQWKIGGLHVQMRFATRACSC